MIIQLFIIIKKDLIINYLTENKLEIIYDK